MCMMFRYASVYLLVLLCMVMRCANSYEAAKFQPKELISDCVVEVLNKVFPKNVSFAYIFNDHPEFFPNDFNVPRVIVNITGPIIGYYGKYENDYVIEAKSDAKLMKTIQKLIETPVWEHGRTNRGRFLLITTEKNLTLTFSIFWRFHITKVVVIQYETEFDRRNATVITGNPFDEQNRCGKTPKAFRYQQCDSRLSVIFDDYVRNFGGCPVITLAGTAGRRRSFTVWDYLVSFVLDQVETTLNARIIHHLGDINITTFFKIASRHEIVICVFRKGLLEAFDNSDGIFTESYVWMGHKPQAIPPHVTYFLPFKGILWVIVIVSLVVVTLTWWLILYKTDSSRTILTISVDVISLLLGVSISNEPHRIALRILIIFYLVYVIHIQTAYTSNLINILVLPKYEDSINNMDQLEQTDMQIYIQESVYDDYFSNNLENYKRIRNRLIVVADYGFSHYLSKLNHTNYFFIIRRSQWNTPKSDSLNAARKGPNFFIDDSLGVSQQLCFVMLKGNYFLPSLNRIISYLHESGYHSWLTKNIDYTYSKIERAAAILGINKEVEHDFQGALTLTHVSGAFFILAVGYAISFAIFWIEFITYHVSARL